MCALLASQSQASDLELGPLDARAEVTQSFKQFVLGNQALYDCEVHIICYLNYLSEPKFRTAYFSEQLLKQDGVKACLDVRKEMSERANSFYSKCLALRANGVELAERFNKLYYALCDHYNLEHTLIPQVSINVSCNSLKEVLDALLDKVHDHKKLQAKQQDLYASVLHQCFCDVATNHMIFAASDYYHDAITNQQQKHMEASVSLMQELCDSFSSFFKKEQDFESSGVAKKVLKQDEVLPERSWLFKLKAWLCCCKAN